MNPYVSTLSSSSCNVGEGSSHLQTITSIGFPIDHIHDLLLHLSAQRIPSSPIVSRTCAIFVYEEVLRIVDVLVRTILNAIDHARFEVEKYRARDVSRIVGLVEEDVFPIAGRVARGEVCEVAGLVYAVFLAQLLPELGADCWRMSVVIARF